MNINKLIWYGTKLKKDIDRPTDRDEEVDTACSLETRTVVSVYRLVCVCLIGEEKSSFFKISMPVKHHEAL